MDHFTKQTWSNKTKTYILLIVIIISTLGCNDSQDSIPKPRMYPRVVFPDRVYQDFDRSDCPFVFQYPTYSKIQQSKAYYEQTDNSCWFDINYTSLNATLYCSYSDIEDQKDFDKKIKENYLLVNKHNKRADFINENIIHKANSPVGVHFEIEGEVATPIQFFLTDTTSHFFRASLYFNAPPNPDSIAPIYKFVKQDLNKMLSTFEWK